MNLSKTLRLHQDLFYPIPLHLLLPIPLPDSLSRNLSDSLPPHPSLLQSQNSTLSHFVTLPLLLSHPLTHPILLILPQIAIDTDNPILKFQF